MKNKKNVLSCLAIMLVGVIYFTLQAQEKTGTHCANFSGEWKSKESISMGGNIVCVYDVSDRMRSKTMKIAQQRDFLTIEVPHPSPGIAPATGREKLAFDGKASEITYFPGRGKKFTVKWSAAGQTMTVNSIVVLAPVSFNTKAQKQSFNYVTEVWKLSNAGNSISVQVKAGERSWKTVFDRVR